jgi:membrane protease YdiL (CAAX protease family)
VPGWEPFTGLSLFVLLVLLALARLSQGAVRDPPQLPPGDDAAGSVESVPRSNPDRETAETQTQTTAESVESGPVTITGDVHDDGPADRHSPTETAEVEGPTGAGHEMSTGALLANVALTQGLFGAVVAAAAWYYEIPATALGLTGGPVATTGAALGVGIIFGVLLWSANEMSATLADAVGAAYDENLREMLAPDSLVGWVVLLAVILPVIAVVEELIFRAALVGVPAAGFGISPWALAILSSVAFALGHGAQGKVGIAVTGTLGFALAGGYILSGSLLVVVVAHYLVNALEFVVHEGLDLDSLLS